MPREVQASALLLRHAGRRRPYRARRRALPGLVSQRASTAIAAGRKAESPKGSDGISIKLSALFSRYEVLQRERACASAAARLATRREGRAGQHQPDDRCRGSRPAREPRSRLLDALAARIATHFPQWRGFGLAVQAYQTRARDVVEARRRDRPPTRAEIHGAPREGRLLGRRDQARPGAGPAVLPGLHAQAAYRRLLPGLRTGAAAASRRHLSAVRERTTPAPSPPSCRWRARWAPSSRCSACTAWARASIAKC